MKKVLKLISVLFVFHSGIISLNSAVLSSPRVNWKESLNPILPNISNSNQNRMAAQVAATEIEEKNKQKFDEISIKSLESGLEKQQERILNLRNRYGDLDFVGFMPIGGKMMNDISSDMYNEMFTDLGSRANWSTQNKVDKIIEILGSGSTIPQKVTYQQGAELFKVVKKAVVPSPTTEYWVTKMELDDLTRVGINFESKSGLPLGSMADEYDIYKITALQQTAAHASTIAPTIQRGYTTTGCANQTLVLDRSLWSLPIKYNTESFILDF